MTELERDNQLLREENKRLQMKLIAIQTLLRYERPVCADKLMEALLKCEDCKGDIQHEARTTQVR